MKAKINWRTQNKNKKRCRKIGNPLQNGQKFDETPCQIPGGCQMGNIFWWSCKRRYFEKDHNSRIESIFEIGEKKNKRQKAKIARFVKNHVSCDGLST